jgi:perosamine synthetase
VGPAIDAFEKGWAAYCGREHGVAVSSGTTALQLSIDALDLRPGDEVIMPAFTIISCALAVVRAEAIPVLVDSDPATWTMDVSDLESRVTERTAAIMPVHIYGHPVDMSAVLTLADSHGLTVIEDAAEAHGAEYLSGDGWVRCGSMGASSCFSFYANKLITTGEGGMVLTDDAALAERLRSSRNLFFGPERRFEHERLGWNARMTNMQAALGMAQLDRVDQIVERKRAIAAAYTERLSAVDGLQLPPAESWARSVYWMYGVVLDDGLSVDGAAFAEELALRGVQTRQFFVGMHEQPALQRLGLFEGESYPVAERLARRGLYLPSGLALSSTQIDEVCDAVAEVLG